MLGDFLLNLAANPHALIKFKADPEQIMGEAGLSDEESRAVKDGDVDKLRFLLHKELSAESASEYDIYNVPTTPHCPVNQTALFSSSFWKVSDPSPIWQSGGLTVVGTGIRAGLQTTPEARVCVERASKALYLVADSVSEAWVRKLNPKAESLQGFYQKGKTRMDIYNEIVEKILSSLRDTRDLCVVFYGHPGVLVYPAREAIRRARAEGFRARMLPGISAEDNLFADLGIDPGIVGVQSYEATSFLVNKQQIDPSAGLILWQIGVLGETRWNPPHRVRSECLQVLVHYLRDYYDANQEVVLYDAAELPAANAHIQRVALTELPRTPISGASTLYIPPKSPPTADAEMLKKLDIKW